MKSFSAMMAFVLSFPSPTRATTWYTLDGTLASAISEYSGQEIDYAFDSDSSTYADLCCSGYPAQWVAYEFSEATSVSVYSMMSSDGECPYDWTFQGWDDAGGVWVTLDTQTGQGCDDYVTYTYTLSSTEFYQKYQWDITAGEGGNSNGYRIRELGLGVTPGDPSPLPTPQPTGSPLPTFYPTFYPTVSPTVLPTATGNPSTLPTISAVPTKAPSDAPTATPTGNPTPVPTREPTPLPTPVPSVVMNYKVPEKGTEATQKDFNIGKVVPQRIPPQMVDTAFTILKNMAPAGY